MKDVYSGQTAHNEEKAVYETPAIIFEGFISTRAGSEVTGGEGKDVDPADIFGGG